MTIRYLAAALTATGLLVLAGCGSSDPDTASTDLPQAEQDYLNAVYKAAREKGSGIHGHGDKKNLKLANDVCDALDEGHAPTDVVKNVKQDPARGVSEVASDIVGNAQLHLCPPEPPE